MQLCVNGNLKKFLEQSRNGFTPADGLSREKCEPISNEVVVLYDNGIFQISILRLIRWCLDIAKGMEFISSKQVSKIWEFNLVIKTKKYTRAQL